MPLRRDELVRQRPATAWIFTTLVVAWQAAFLASNSGYVDRRPVWTGIWSAFGLASLAALVVWRQRWAWWLFLAGPVYYVVSPAWGARFHPFWDGAELAVAGLLLSPSMRRYVFAQRRRRRFLPLRRGSPWIMPLILSAALTVPTTLGERHPAAHHLAARILGAMLFWLTLAAAIRLVVFVFDRLADVHRRRPGRG